ncbi:MAG: hypothetical protein ABSE73_13215, partial [Planctomycetota bacterium]
MKGHPETKGNPDRRQFVGGALAAAASAVFLRPSPGYADEKAPEPKAEPKKKIKLGLVGCGGRGNWLLNLFKQHGGYEFYAMADYFQDAAEASGKNFGVDKARCFGGLSGYKKLIESGVEAVAIIDVPYFYPEQGRDAVAAGVNVYMAKP